MTLRTAWEKRPVWVADTLVAVTLAALAVFSLATLGASERSAFSRDVDTYAYLLVLAQTLPLAFRRVYPIAVLSAVTAAFVVDRLADYPTTVATIGIAFAFHALGSELPRKRSLVVGLPLVALLTLFTVSGAIYYDSVTWTSVFFMALLTAAPLLLGSEVYERRRYTTELEDRAERLEREREERAREAVREERARIARELHDVVAHEMTIMTIQAAAAQRVIDSDPDAARKALGAIEGAGHDALAEMRLLLALLRPEREGVDLTPQPGLDRLDALVAKMQKSGLDVELTVTGTQRELPAGVDLSAYRIVQESLVNTLKHGGSEAKATVQLGYGADHLDIDIEDDGRGAAESLVTGNGDGQGLVGMRERVALLHGVFTAGPRPGGGYRVQARIPL